MGDGYDAVIVGAGLGGLTAAARLLGEGLRVLVVERDPHPGGTAYLYRRKGFLFPMGPLGFSSPEVVNGVLGRVGMEELPGLRRVHYQLRAFGLRVPLSLPYPQMVEQLSEMFPGEAPAITRFFAHMREMSSALQTPAGGGPPPRLGGQVSAAEYLAGLVKDWRLRRILGSMGSREPYSSAGLLAAMWALLCDKGIHYPEGGTARLSDMLASGLGWEPAWLRGGGPRAGAPSPGGAGAPAWPGTLRFSRGSGQLLLRGEVAGIRVEKGRARGVLLADGTRLEADAVISNADYKATFLRLVPRDAVPEGLYRAVASARQTSSNLQVCLGIDSSRTDLSAFREASRVIYRRGAGAGPPPQAGPDWDAPEIDPRALAGEELEATLLSADDPHLAPEGQAVVVIRVAAPHRHFARFRPRSRRRLAGYFAYKTRLAGALVEEVSTFVPGLADAVMYMDVATPLTFEERGGRSEGAVAGWSWDYMADAAAHAVELVRTPVAGLYMAGYQAYSMLSLGGVPSAMLSGLEAAEYLLAGAGPVSELPVPGFRV